MGVVGSSFAIHLDDEAVDRILREHMSVMWYIAARKFRLTRDDVEDVLQDVLLAFVTTDAHIRDPRAWLVAATCNAARTRLRRNTRWGEDCATITPDIPDSVLTVERLENELLAYQVLRRLPSATRDVLKLHYFLGMTDRDIAARYGTTVRYAQKLISKALHAARAVLKEFASFR